MIPWARRCDHRVSMLRLCAGRPTAGTRRGSAYLLVLVTVAIVTATGLSALMVQRIRVRSAAMSADAMEARNAAVSAIELGLQTMVTDPNWRTTLGGGTWLNSQPLGSGVISLKVVRADGSALPKGSVQPATLLATGTVGLATQMVELTVQDTPLPEIPMAALSYAASVGGDISEKNKRTITVVGAPMTTNAAIVLGSQSTIIGDVQAMSRIGSGTITGTVTIPSTIKPIPDATAMASSISQATVLGTNNLKNVLLSSSSNPYGIANPNGVYIIKSFGSDVIISELRLLGTLIVDTGGGTLFINNSVLMESPAPAQPVLLVVGNLDISLDSRSGRKPLDESTSLVNFNPVGTPYLGATDTDTVDTYPNTIRGLIHVTGTVIITNQADLTGVLIVGSTLNLDKGCTLIHDPAIASTPPPGYTYSPGWTTTIVSGSWKKRVN